MTRHPPSRGGSPHPRRRPLLTAGVLVLVGLLLAALGAGQKEAPSPQLNLTSARGAIELSNSRAGGAILVAHRLRPGASVHGHVTISNTGGAAGLLRLSKAHLVDAPGPRGGRLSRRLGLVVREVGGKRARAYAGTLAGMPTLSLGTLAPNQARKYRFTVRFPRGAAPALPGAGDNAYQGSSVRVVYVWRAEQAEPNVVAGTAGDDTLVGTPGDDVIVSGGGRDRVEGRGGDDVVRGASGDDIVDGGPGDDRLFGSSGSDLLHGGPGDDELVGGSGEDRLLGGSGTDRLDGRLEPAQGR